MGKIITTSNDVIMTNNKNIEIKLFIFNIRICFVILTLTTIAMSTFHSFAF